MSNNYDNFFIDFIFLGCSIKDSTRTKHVHETFSSTVESFYTTTCIRNISSPVRKSNGDLTDTISNMQPLSSLHLPILLFLNLSPSTVHGYINHNKCIASFFQQRSSVKEDTPTTSISSLHHDLPTLTSTSFQKNETATFLLEYKDPELDLHLYENSVFAKIPILAKKVREANEYKEQSRLIRRTVFTDNDWVGTIIITIITPLVYLLI